MFVPHAFLGALGWTVVDPVAARLVAAALFAIGIESWLGRRSSLTTFRAMLDLKIIWSATAILGFVLSLVAGAHGRQVSVWGLLAVFAAFHLLWVYFRIQVGKLI